MIPRTLPLIGSLIGAPAQESVCRRSTKCSCPKTCEGRFSSSAVPMPLVPMNFSA
jgi:hypothetical protein